MLARIFINLKGIKKFLNKNETKKLYGKNIRFNIEI